MQAAAPLGTRLTELIDVMPRQPSACMLGCLTSLPDHTGYSMAMPWRTGWQCYRVLNSFALLLANLVRFDVADLYITFVCMYHFMRLPFATLSGALNDDI